MKYINGLVGVLGIASGALFAFGCANGEAGMEEEVTEATAEATQALVTSEAAKSDKAPVVLKSHLAGTLSEKVGQWPAKKAYWESFVLNKGQNLNATTSNAASGTGTDTVLVIYERTDGKGGSDNWSWLGDNYGDQHGIWTHKLNDDSSGLYSSVSWTNPTNGGWDGRKVVLQCFTFCSPKTTASCSWASSVTLSGSSPSGSFSKVINCSAPAYKYTTNGGHIYTRWVSGGTDPALFAFNPANNDPSNTFYNDDCADSSIQDPSKTAMPCITGLTGGEIWWAAWGRTDSVMDVYGP